MIRACSCLAAAVSLACAIAACGGPEEPRTKTEPGALAPALSFSRSGAGVPVRPAPARIPYVIIRFDRPGLSFEDALYSALARALDRYPGAKFDVVLAMPPLAPRGDPEESLRRGEQHIEAVVLSMTDMGLPAARLRIAASTDPDATVDEIRIFVR
jgi:hypothetical protein